MDTNLLVQHSRQVEALIGAATSRQVDQALAKLAEAEQWELMGALLPTASETAARRIVSRLLEEAEYGSLAGAACLRRQVRRPGMAPAGARRPAHTMFQDIDAEDDSAGVPEHIMADVEELADAATERRAISERHTAEVDRDPVRDLIVDQLAARLPEAGAGEALLIIAKACPFDQTRRQAAMKLANHKHWISQLVAENRATDLIAISESAKLKAVAESVARLLGEQMAQLRQAGDQAALNFIAEHHPNGDMRQAAHQALA